MLIIGHVWPEPNSTAAGARMMQLIQFFLESRCPISFVCSAMKTENSHDLVKLGIECHKIEVNNSDFDVLIQNIDPQIVLFDRFYTEEKFGWRISEVCPKAIKVLDTEDLHFLRHARQNAVKKKDSINLNYLINDITKREIASIYRCDISLIISSYEVELLQNTFHIAPSLLLYLPFMLERIDNSKFKSYPSYDNRNHFISIGNFRHEPNWNSVQLLNKIIWPLIRRKLPQAELHLYGSYATDKVIQLHDIKSGFIIKGRAISAEDVFPRAKVCLAPLQFGAGLKGKLFDSMRFGTPSVTTKIGAEGMSDGFPWNGFIADNNEEFANKAIELYKTKEIWSRAQLNGIDIINELFSKEIFYRNLHSKLKKVYEQLDWHRLNNFVGSILEHHTLKSTKYLSKWIEAKSKKN